MFSDRQDLDVASAGLAPDAEEFVTPELLRWAELILVMEKTHRSRLQRRFGADIRHAKVGCLDIPEDYEFMDERLVKRLQTAVPPLLRRGS